MKSATALYCLVIFLLQAALQLASLFPDCHISMAHGGLLMILGSFGLIAAAFNRHNERRVGEASKAPSEQMAKWRELPRWLRWTVQSVSIYLVILVVAALLGLRHGSAEMRADGYWAGSYKRSIPYRRISEAEYWWLEGHQARLLTALGMMVCGIPLLAYAARSRPKRQG